MVHVRGEIKSKVFAEGKCAFSGLQYSVSGMIDVLQKHAGELIFLKHVPSETEFRSDIIGGESGEVLGWLVKEKAAQAKPVLTKKRGV